ncbi:hypothetical protein TWF730_002701 [Orbilia blumenaviensis]|uniref:Uncharacterized protein n=1 Tax=Orbilia blumenaviensis TaxID=1796055 RepID=A0AAV9U6Y2_9PEZI
MAEVAVLGPLARGAWSLYQMFDGYKRLDKLIDAFAQQLRMVGSSIESLQENVKEQRRKRLEHPELQGSDSIDRDMGELLEGVNEINEKTERFFKKNKIAFEDGKSQITGVQRGPRAFFLQNHIKEEILILRDRYCTVKCRIDSINQSLTQQMIRELNSHRLSGDQDRVTEGRLRERGLLTYPRTTPIEPASKPPSETTQAVNPGQTTAIFKAGNSFISEDELRHRVQNKHTESQEYLFRLFRKDLESYPADLEHFRLGYLLNKIWSWLSIGEWPSERISYARNYIKLMKSGWLLGEIIERFPVSSVNSKANIGTLTESYLLDIQETIINRHPNGRMPPSVADIEEIPEFKQICRLELDTQGHVLQPGLLLDHTRGIDGVNLNGETVAQTIRRKPLPPRIRPNQFNLVSESDVAFERTFLDYGGQAGKTRHIKVRRNSRGLAGDISSGRLEGDIIIIEDQTIEHKTDLENGIAIQSREVTRTGDPNYNKSQTMFTPEFYRSKDDSGGSMGNSGGKVYLRRLHHGKYVPENKEFAFSKTG